MCHKLPNPIRILFIPELFQNVIDKQVVKDLLQCKTDNDVFMELAKYLNKEDLFLLITLNKQLFTSISISAGDAELSKHYLLFTHPHFTAPLVEEGDIFLEANESDYKKWTKGDDAHDLAKTLKYYELMNYGRIQVNKQTNLCILEAYRDAWRAEDPNRKDDPELATLSRYYGALRHLLLTLSKHYYFDALLSTNLARAVLSDLDKSDDVKRLIAKREDIFKLTPLNLEERANKQAEIEESTRGEIA